MTRRLTYIIIIVISLEINSFFNCYCCYFNWVEYFSIIFRKDRGGGEARNNKDEVVIKYNIKKIGVVMQSGERFLIKAIIGLY